MKLFHQLKHTLANHQITGNKASWLLFVALFILLLGKTVAFHWFVYNILHVSYGLRTPWAFWLPKVAISLFLANIVWICRKKWPLVLMLLIVDLWIIANMMYFRANNTLITWESITMASNLHGFGQSIGFYYNWQSTLMWLSSLCYILLLPWVTITQKRYTISAGVLGITLICFGVGNRLHLNEKMAELVQIAPENKWKYYIPFYEPERFRRSWLGSTYYARQHSIIAYLPTLINNNIEEAIAKPTLNLTPEEEARIALCLREPCDTIVPRYNLMFILVESFESFALDVKNTRGEYILPNFRRLMEQPNMLYANQVKSQVRHGVSADGKLIVNTGILPLQEGAAAMLFPANQYPNYGHLYTHSFWSHPTPATAWNQYLMTQAYGYQKMLGGNKEFTLDEEAFTWVQPILTSIGQQSFVYFLTTINSHSPFNFSPLSPSLMLPEDMPLTMKQYLACLHVTDRAFGQWYQEWSATQQAQNTVLVITSDHTVFRDAILRDFQPYAEKANLSIATGQSACPLIIVAPNIEGQIHITESIYQMDIYPTILHLIGAENYFWQGFGVNLLDPQARQNRIFTEKEAYQLSDKIIRSNYLRRP